MTTKMVSNEYCVLRNMVREDGEFRPLLTAFDYKVSRLRDRTGNPANVIASGPHNSAEFDVGIHPGNPVLS